MVSRNTDKKFDSQMLDIRFAIADDIPILLELFENGRLEHQTHENDTGADLDHLMAGYFECKDSGFWVAEISAQIVGMIGVQRINDDAAEIRRLRVRDTYRRQGIGKQLMEHAILFCRDKQFLKVVLDVRIERVSAINMFDTFGFVHSHERDFNGRKLRDFYLDLYSETTGDHIQ